MRECVSTLCVTLPMMRPVIPRRPCEAMKIRSQCLCVAAAMMPACGESALETWPRKGPPVRELHGALRLRAHGGHGLHALAQTVAAGAGGELSGPVDEGDSGVNPHTRHIDVANLRLGTNPIGWFLEDWVAGLRIA